MFCFVFDANTVIHVCPNASDSALTQVFLLSISYNLKSSLKQTVKKNIGNTYTTFVRTWASKSGIGLANLVGSLGIPAFAVQASAFSFDSEALISPQSLVQD